MIVIESEVSKTSLSSRVKLSAMLQFYNNKKKYVSLLFTKLPNK